MNNNYYFNINTFNSKELLNTNLFKMVSINIRSISSITKFNKFKKLLSTLPVLPAVIAVQETWFKENVVQIYNLPGYKSIHCCRSDGYGGTSLFIREEICFKEVENKTGDFIDYIVVRLDDIKVDRKPITLMSFYKSPKCNGQFFLEFLDDYLERYGRTPSIFVGDANIDGLEVNEFSDILYTLSAYDFQNCHNLITRPLSSSCLDHVYSNILRPMAIDSIECNLSDHNLIHIAVDVRVKLKEVERKSVAVCDFDLLKEQLETDLDILQNTGNCSVDTENLLNCIKVATEASTFTKNKNNILKNKLTPWINGNLHNLIAYKNRLLKQRRKNPSCETLKSMLRRISKVINKSQKFSMNNYYESNLTNFQNDPKRTWRFLNDTLGRSSKSCVNIFDEDGVAVVNNLDKAEMLNKYFAKSVENLKRGIEILPMDHFNSLRTVRRCGTVFEINQTTAHEMYVIVSGLSLSKSCGHDNVSPKILKECSSSIVPQLVNIFNTMLNTGEYPEILKIHKIVPIPKERSPTAMSSFRPISVLSSVNNVFEKILYRQLSAYFEQNSLLNPSQYGFRRGCGTEEATINVINYICKLLDEGYNGVAGIFFDLTKAFDMIDHDIMVQKLRNYGVRGNELSLFKSYLENRKQFVQINECKSSMISAKHGVPQGSTLGPLLFIIYMNDLVNLELTGKLFMYADDICVFYPYKSEAVVKSYMERDASLICEYMRVNKLFLNESKTKIMRFRPLRHFNSQFSLNIGGKEIKEVSTIKYLGLHLQSNLAWDEHIRHLKLKISPALGLLYKFKNKFDTRTKFLIYQSLIGSHLNYLAIIYAHKNNTALKSLQRLQNRSLKAVANLDIRHSTSSLYHDIFPSVMPIYCRYRFQVLLYVYKCLKNIGHHTLLFTRNQSSFNTRNNQQLRVVLCRTETTKQRIEYAGCHAFNALPQIFNEYNSIQIFKRKLKEYLLSHVDEFV